MGLLKLFLPNVNKLKQRKDVGGLINALNHKNFEIKMKAIAALGDIGDPIAADPLLDLYHTYPQNSHLRSYTENSLCKQILNALAEIGDIRALEILLKSIVDLLEIRLDYDEKDRLRKKAENNIEKIAIANGKEIFANKIIELLKKYKGSYEADILLDLLKPVGEFVTEGEIEFLLSIIDSDLGYKVRYILLKIGAPVIDPMVQYYLSADVIANGKIYVAECLHSLGWMPEHSTDKYELLKLIGAWDDIIGLGESVVENLLQELSNGFCYPELRRAIREIGDERAIEKLMVYIKNKNTKLIAIIKNENTKRDTKEIAIQAVIDDNDKESIRELAVFLISEFDKSDLTKSGREKQGILSKNLLNAILKFEDHSFASIILSDLFLCPRNFNRLTADFQILFGDYTDLILNASSYRSESKVSETDWERWINYEYLLNESDKAVKKLISINSSISSNILYYIKNKPGVTVAKSHYDEFKSAVPVNKNAYLSFEKQCEQAEQELKKRGNPTFDESAFLDKKEWKIYEIGGHLTNSNRVGPS